MKFLFFSLLLISFIILNINPVKGSGKDSFDGNMQIWEEKRTLATQYLLSAEEQLKKGNRSLGCAKQKMASQYGIEASKALIKAMEINGSIDGIENLEVGLNKWKELGDFC